MEGLPKEFIPIFDHICNLKFEERPNYALIRMKLRKMILILSKDTEPIFEWIPLLSKLKY